MMKKVFLLTALGALLFLLSTNKAKAADIFSCYKNGACTNITASSVTQAETEGQCVGGEIAFRNECPPPGAAKPASPSALQTGCKLNDKGQEICSLENPLAGNVTEATTIISTAIKAALGIVGALALLMLVWGGFQWLTSAGNPEKVKSGTQTMIWAIIGVVLVFASYLVLSTFTSYLTGG
ncbi:MAG: membrane protein of unknown function [Parcubacteria group bacterium Gr01-1014_13]|nr:MAG: membrane protein of unknown function [Parcubacteria group bacterium Gr01-1014_13]